MPALLIIAWLVRDIRAADGPSAVWEYWSGTADLRDAPRTTTSVTSLVLLSAYAAAAVAALRSASAAPFLIVTGAVTFALRLPGVWTIADASAPEELRDRALLTTYVALAAGLGMIVAGVAGRRPAPEGAERPVGPGRGAGVAVFLLLGFQALTVAAWEIRQPFVYPSELYPAWFIGGGPLTVPLTEGPPGWVAVTHVLMFLVAAVGAVAGAAHARPLGLIAGGFVLTSGVLGTARIIHYEMYEHFLDTDIEAQLNMLSSVSSLLVGPVVIIVLARKGVGRTPAGGAPGPWGGGGPWGAQPPGYPPAQTAPGQQPPAPGFGPPQGGGFGPPPSSPPPRW
ncbi:hypothetical protein [Streptomyces sp. McG3]|uniref:hypothetical protein n=1 Tax=Streptomyces sp. McG3 TaxID=2725483 RepID=UPI001BEA7BDB|nr:hypothetical protein [Streptomyces sp. McG3]MBT2898699.1 hypothetical protein [Streptomyces sp. McG3]